LIWVTLLKFMRMLLFIIEYVPALLKTAHRNTLNNNPSLKSLSQTV
jgi:hypothetical protein